MDNLSADLLVSLSSNIEEDLSRVDLEYEIERGNIDVEINLIVNGEQVKTFIGYVEVKDLEYQN